MVYDNRSIDDRLLSSHGFSCLIEVKGVKVLFDTGGDVGKLMYNMGVLGVDPRAIDIVITSHNHWDHVAGLSTLLSINPRIIVIPPTYSSKPMEIVENVWITGGVEAVYKDQKIVEQALIVDLGDGLALVTGCSHPWVGRFAEIAYSALNKRIKMVMGGWHLVEKKISEIVNILKSLERLGSDLYIPCHCVPDKGLEVAKKVLANRFSECGVGLELKF